MRRRVELGIEVPADIAGDVASKLWYVSDRIVDPRLDAATRTVVSFGLRGDDESEIPRIEANIRRLASEMCTAHRPVEGRVLAQVGDGVFGTGDDPHPEWLRSGELVEFGPGRYGLGPRLTGLVRRLDDLCLEFAAEMHASPRQFPSLIGGDAMDACRYIRSFPHSLCLVSHLREDLDRIEAFAREARWTDDRLAVPSGSLDDVRVLLAPSVCFHAYAALANAQLAGPLTFTAAGRCFRYESGNLSGLERLWDFTMREVVFVGTADDVPARRDESIGRVVRLLERIGLQFTVETASDPFFIDGFGVQTTFQKLFDLKFEILAPLPYAGRSLAVGSLNYHQDFFGRAFDIRTADGAAAHTGCVGFGLERLALAVAAQHGIDPGRWPEVLRAG